MVMSAFFWYNGKKYFMQGLTMDGQNFLEAYIFEPVDSEFE
jgi:hypothetical protein